MDFLYVAIAFALGVIFSGRIIAAVHGAETSLHDRLRAMTERLTALEEAIKGKL